MFEMNKEKMRSAFVSLGLTMLLGMGGVWAQKPGVDGSKAEVKQQIRQDQTMKIVKDEVSREGYKPSVRRQVELGKTAFHLEQYAVAYDRFLRAFTREKDTGRQHKIEYMMGRSQQRMNHPKAAALHYAHLWRAGVRTPDFLQSYLEVLFAVTAYSRAERILSELKNIGVSTHAMQTYEKSLRNLDYARQMQEAFGLLPQDVHYDSAINTAFSEYAPTLIMGGRLVFTSSRPQVGQTVSDPRTAQGYSRLFYATYDPYTKMWVNPQPFTGEIAELKGNIGTFSYDSVHNLGFFTWNQVNSSGIYTVQLQPDGTWGNLQEFLFNHKEGEDNFIGKVAHPSISKDGRRLLFVYRDAKSNTGSDIWYVERKAPVETKTTRKRKKVPTPTQQVKADAKAKTKAKKMECTEDSHTVVVNADWEVPVRLNDLVNTPGREVFPQWVNDSMFVFASDGHVGQGGTDLYAATMSLENRSNVLHVDMMPMPINSSYDDNTLIPDMAHGGLILSSNRHTNWGRTDNIYLLRTWGFKYKVEGTVSHVEIRYDTVPLASASTPSFTSPFAAPAVAATSDSIRKLTDSTAAAPAPTPAPAVTDSAASNDTNLVFHPSGMPFTPSNTVEPEPKYKIDTIRKYLKNYYLMVRSVESDFYASVVPDSTGLYSISFLDPGTYKFTLYADGFKDTTKVVVLDKNAQVLPLLVNRRVDFETKSVFKPKPKPKKPKPKDTIPKPKPKKPKMDSIKKKPKIDSLKKTDTIKKKDTIAKPKPKMDSIRKKDTLSKALVDKLKRDSMPKSVIKDIDKVKKIQQKPDKRTVDDYKKRINDPLRRAKLTVVPPNAKCEVCTDKPEWRRNVGEDFYIKSGEDKAIITLTDQQGHVSYIDLAPNTAYSLNLQMTAKNGLPSLPKGIKESDIRKKVVTRDYILFECTPKLAEVNDEVYINNVYYDFDKEELIKDGSRELDRMIIIALKNPQMIFEVESNTDERGTDEYNQKLSDRRLQTVRSYVEKKGMDMSRFKGKSYGESNPLIRNAVTDKEHYLNRRTTFRLRNPNAVNVKKGDATYPVPEVNMPREESVYFMVQIGAFRSPLEEPEDYYQDIVSKLSDLKITYYMDADGLYKYNIGQQYKTLESAQAVVKRLLDINRECYIAAFYQGRRITVNEAKAVLNHGKSKR